MKTVLMGLILVLSVSAQARVIIQSGNHQSPTKLSISQINLDRYGAVVIKSGTENIAIPKAAIERTGLTTKDFVEFLQRYNDSTTETMGLSVRLNPDNSVAYVTVSFGK